MIQKYIIHLSNKSEVQIDEDEVEIVVESIKTGKIGRVRQGIFNPSFFVSLTMDDKRYEQYKSDNQYRGGANQQPLDNRTLAPLKDIFQNILPEAKTSKKLK